MEKSKLFCVNCNKYGYPASYRGCSKLVENKKRLMKSNTISNGTRRYDCETKPRINKALRRPDFSYVDIARKSAQVNTNTSDIVNTQINNIVDTNNRFSNSTEAIVIELKNN